MSSRELKRLERQVATLKRQLDAASATLVTVTEVLGTAMAGDGAVSNAASARTPRAAKAAVDKPTTKSDKPTAKTDKAAASDKGSKSSRSSKKTSAGEEKSAKPSRSSKKRD